MPNGSKRDGTRTTLAPRKARPIAFDRATSIAESKSFSKVSAGDSESPTSNRMRAKKASTSSLLT